MPMDREEYEKLLDRLNNPELSHEERTEVLSTLREDYNNVLTEHKELTETNDHLTKDNDSLVRANSKLFRQVGIQDDEEHQEKEQQKEFSETVTIEQLQAQSQN